MIPNLWENFGRIYLEIRATSRLLNFQMAKAHQRGRGRKAQMADAVGHLEHLDHVVTKATRLL